MASNAAFGDIPAGHAATSAVPMCAVSASTCECTEVRSHSAQRACETVWERPIRPMTSAIVSRASSGTPGLSNTEQLQDSGGLSGDRVTATANVDARVDQVGLGIEHLPHRAGEQ